jgi:hypothetical protein
VPPYTPIPDNRNKSRTYIQIQLEVYGVKQVDMMASTVTFKAAFRQWWNDSRLTWDPSQYGEVDTIYLKSDPQFSPRAWISDIIVREDAGTGMLSDFKYTDVRVKSSGLNYYSRMGDLTVQASFDMAKYPYDR